MVRPKKHGFTGTALHHAWRQMRYRCRNKNAPEYKNYGGRGIKVCERWHNFQNFIDDMGVPDHSNGRLTLDRIDNNGDYEPGNCRWATYKEQLNNRRDSNMVTAFGRTQTVTQWAEEYKLSVTTLRNRLFQLSMHPEDALSAPLYAQQREKQIGI